jgi:hypothetical protein
MTQQFKVIGVAAVILLGCACSKPPSTEVTIKKMSAGKEFSGFLSKYDNLKPNAQFENTVSFVSQDPQKNVHKYDAIIVDRPEVYVSTDSDEKLVTDDARDALIGYFQSAITQAVESAFPVVETKGPLVLRLRSALIGVDVSGAAAGQKGDGALEHPINIGKVAVEMELVDSETGEQVAAAVDRQNLGDGAMIGSTTFSREEKFEAAREAFDGWATRLREFLDSAHERSDADISRIEGTNFPYGPQSKKK